MEIMYISLSCLLQITVWFACREEQLTEMNAEVESRLHEKEADLLALKEENSKGPSLQVRIPSPYRLTS